MSNDLLDDTTFINKELPNFVFVGFWRRLVATFFDCIAVFIYALLASVLTLPIAFFLPDGIAEICQTITFLGVLALYSPFLESTKAQATFGKEMMGIKVVHENGTKLTFNDAFLRFLAKWLSLMLFFMGFIMIFFTNKKQGLHDILVNTYVVEK